MGSVFDSILPNLMVKGVVEALAKKKEEIPVVYFPKPTLDLQTEGLTSFKEIFEVMERSIQGLPGQEGFNMGRILTHFIVPRVSDKEVNNYVTRVKRELKKYLTDEANKSIEKSLLTGKDALIFLKSIVLNDANFNAKTRGDVDSGRLKRSKLVPGIIIEFTQSDRKFLEARNIKVVEPDAEEQDDLFRYVAGKINYNVDGVARDLDKLATEHRSKYVSFIQEKARMRAPVKARVSFGRPGDNLLQVDNIDIPSFDVNNPDSVRKRPDSC